MNDQTRHGIDHIQSKNKAKGYKDKTKKLFEEWLKKCPIVYDTKNENSDNETVTINFNLKERR